MKRRPFSLKSMILTSVSTCGFILVAGGHVAQAEELPANPPSEAELLQETAEAQEPADQSQESTNLEAEGVDTEEPNLEAPPEASDQEASSPEENQSQEENQPSPEETQPSPEVEPRSEQTADETAEELKTEEDALPPEELIQEDEEAAEDAQDSIEKSENPIEETSESDLEPTASSEVSLEEDPQVQTAAPDFERDSYHLGAITEVATDPNNANIINLAYETGQYGQIQFLEDNIFRYTVDPDGEFPDKPDTTRPNGEPGRPAEFIVKPTMPEDNILAQLETTNDIVRVNTEAITIELDRKSSLMKVFNKDGKVVLEEVAPLHLTENLTTQSLARTEKGQYFGGGTQNGRFNHTGDRINIVNENAWEDGDVASPNPFYWSTDGYGVVRHTFQRGYYDFGENDPSQVQTEHEEDRFDAYYIIGNSPQEILQGYYEVTGEPIVLPIFSLYQGHLNAYNRDYWVPSGPGNPNSHDNIVYFEEVDGWYREIQPNSDKSNVPDNAILETLISDKDDENYIFTAAAVIDRYERYDMPLGWFLPNDGYGAGYGQEDSIDANVANLRRFAEYALSRGIKTGLWTQSDLTPNPEEPVHLQRDLEKEVRDGLVRALKTDVAWVGPGYSFGLNGIIDAAEVMNEASQEDARPFIVTLNGWAGTQHYGGIWTGDQTGGEWEYIRFHIPTYIGTELSGNPNVGSDMDGIFGGSNPIMNNRDYQWKTFTGMQLNMDGWGTNPKTPFAFDDATTDINRSYLKFKSILVPYAYSLMHEAVDGNPIVAAMFIHFPDEAVNYTEDVQYQYMYGENLLVAPIYQETDMQENGDDIRHGIYLPAGEKWIDFYTGDVYEGGQMLNNFQAPRWKLPLFVRAGAIIPMTEAHNNYTEIPQDLRKVSFYPSGSSDFVLYEDDGLTMAYTGDEIVKTLITSDQEGDQVHLTIEASQGDYPSFVKEKVTQFDVNVTKEPEVVKLIVNGQEVALTRVDSRQAFEEGHNVYFYDEAYDLNQFAYDSEYKDLQVIKNPVLRVRTDLLDVTQNKLELFLEGFEYQQDKFSEIAHEDQGPAPAIQVEETAVDPYALGIVWTPVEDAERYELDIDGVVYTNITDPYWAQVDLTPETDYQVSVRAIAGDTATEWSDPVTLTTAEDPYRYAISDISVSSNRPAQGGQEHQYLVDLNLNTQYHSRWNQPAIPEELSFDLGLVHQLDRIEYHPRRDAGNGTITEGNISFSVDGVNWTDPQPIQWEHSAEPKIIDLSGQKARYVNFNVTAGVGDYVSGQELLFMRDPETEPYLLGDVTGDNAINDMDIRFFRDNAGLKESDPDFDNRFVQQADTNGNGVIDAYDAYTATRQYGDDNHQPARPVAGNLTYVVDKGQVAAGDLVTVTIKGEDLQGVQALNARYDVDSDLFEYVADSLTLSGDVSGMGDFSIVRDHHDGSQSVNIILANQRSERALEGDATIASFQLKAKVDTATDQIVLEPLFIVGEDLRVVEDLDPTTPRLVTADRIQISGQQEVFQQDLDGLVDDRLDTLVELKWDVPSNHNAEGKLPEEVSLPQEVHFNFDEPLRLSHVQIHKRPSSNGTLTKYQILAYKDNELVHESEIFETPLDSEWTRRSLNLDQDIDQVTLRFIEAKNGNGEVDLSKLTLKEVQFFERADLTGTGAPAEPEEQDPHAAALEEIDEIIQAYRELDTTFLSEEERAAVQSTIAGYEEHGDVFKGLSVGTLQEVIGELRAVLDILTKKAAPGEKQAVMDDINATIDGFRALDQAYLSQEDKDYVNELLTAYDDFGYTLENYETPVLKEVLDQLQAELNHLQDIVNEAKAAEEPVEPGETPDPEQPGEETPETDEPGEETPGTDEPGETPDPEQPGEETPGTDEPGEETPGTDEPGEETPGTDEPDEVTPGTDEPGEETPGTDEPGEETPGTDEPGEQVEPDKPYVYQPRGDDGEPRPTDLKFVSSSAETPAGDYTETDGGERLPDTASLTWLLGLIGSTSLLGGAALSIKDRKKK